MNISIICLLIGSLQYAVLVSLPAGADFAETVALAADRLIDGHGHTVHQQAVVLVEGERITAPGASPSW